MPSYGKPAYWDFSAAGQSELLWDTIVLAFAASRDLEVEVCEPPEGFTVDGQETTAFGMTHRSIEEALLKALRRNNLRDHVRVHGTRKKGGHIWLQKVGAELYSEKLESERLVPYWTKKRRKRKHADV